MLLEWIAVFLILSVSIFAITRKIVRGVDFPFIIIAIGSLCVIFALSAYTSANYTVEKVVISQNELVAIKDSENIHGSFMLASGSIGQVDYYKYDYIMGNAIYRGKIKTEGVPVYEEDRKDGIIVAYILIYHYKPTAFDPLLRPWDTTSKCGSDFEACKYYEFHVPKGTYKKNLDFSLS